MDTFEIARDDLRADDIALLLLRHLKLMANQSPPESIHALDLDALRQPDVAFWRLSCAGTLAACGALKILDAQHGEIKSMHTAHEFRGRGCGAAMLRHLIDEATRRSIRRLSLETGSAEPFLPARRLYARFGFTLCEPFADYREDPHSVFMTRLVDSAPRS